MSHVRHRTPRLVQTFPSMPLPLSERAMPPFSLRLHGPQHGVLSAERLARSLVTGAKPKWDAGVRSRPHLLRDTVAW